MSKREFLLLALVTLLSIGVFLGFSQANYGPGFPLDDAWIHQTYARNLVERGEWAFLPGEPSAGSTGPLWSLLLAIGYWIGWAPFGWTFLLGWGGLLALALLGVWAWKRMVPEAAGIAPVAGVLLAVEWHMVWAATSGMETLLFTVLVFIVLLWVSWGRIHWLGVGIAVGVICWIRPDGITLWGALGLAWWLRWREKTSGLWEALQMAFGFGLVFLPYLGFNRALSGMWWPTTFYAKQIEYAVLQGIPFWKRWLDLAAQPLIGAGVLALPGLVGALRGAVENRRWEWWIAPLWALGYLTLYAWRLPVTYQHGRYLMPIIPVLCLWGLRGWLKWWRLQLRSVWKWVIVRSGVLSMGVLSLLFVFLGGQAYARDVGFIQTEMVAAARWVAQNTDEQALIAAHDIGALGYYGQRRLVDLAGLVTPEVIPILRDEEALQRYLDEQGADYLVTFPGWYPRLTEGLTAVYITQGTLSPELGGENMRVYRWPH
jgi:hypothetical protein